MKIGIMGAMPQEVVHIREDIENMVEHEYAGRKYYEGTLYGNETVLVFSRWGKVAAATTATILITQHKVDLILFCGVVGGISSKLNIGDIVIANELFQHDLDARPLFELYQIHLTDKKFLSPDTKLVEKAGKSIDDFLKTLTTLISTQILNKFSICKPKVIFGPIASGDQFVNGNDIPTKILKNKPDTLCVEMEGAAVAQICEEHAIPFIVLRTISDKADHTAPIDFQEFINEVACIYSKGIVRSLYKHQVWL